MLVTILVQIVSNAADKNGPDQYLYRNDELGCYIRDVIAADGKETHNTGKRTVTVSVTNATSMNLM